MRTAFGAIIVSILLTATVVFAGQTKFSFQAQDMAIKEAVDALSKKSGFQIMIDPKADAKVTASLSDVEINQVLDAITKSANLKWKKLTFAVQEDSQISFEQLKWLAAALEAVPVMAVSMEQPGVQTKISYIKNQPLSEAAEPSLPDGYAWKTVYVILSPNSTTSSNVYADASDSASSSEKVKAVAESAARNTFDIAKLTPEERRQVYAGQIAAEMTLVPEVRQEMLRDRLIAIFGMDEQYRNQFFSDMRYAFQQARELRRELGLPEPTRGGPNNRNGNWGGRDGQNRNRQ